MLTSALPVLDTKAVSTGRICGSRWMKIREHALIAGVYTNVDCGRVHASNQGITSEILSRAAARSMSW